jgi:hypothetical protein
VSLLPPSDRFETSANPKRLEHLFLFPKPRPHCYLLGQGIVSHLVNHAGPLWVSSELMASERRMAWVTKKIIPFSERIYLILGLRGLCFCF